ncbi:Acetyl-CoA carboxylase 2 [Camellia lanceoleosa]|uniref:Acetyl-CoA carboxylase 2 n=1 Tax=Camellia lanceoleosa TaxID=1840588 RepID=A0ACC0FFV0_9ERIC|nr:Acetyl-CoA carboxylase 2 [Camellia lanceoleosa]
MWVRAERPPWYLSVVGGALYKASTSSAAMVSEYFGYLEKGQIPPKVPVVVDKASCNANEDINFRFTRFTVSRRVVGSVGGESCSNKNGGPSNVNVGLLSPTGDLVTSVLTSPTGSYSFTNIIPGKYKLRASRPDFNVEVRGSAEVELRFENGLVDDIFFVPGYDIRGSVVAQGDPILGVHIYLYSNDISRVDCALGSSNAPGQRKALCHAVSDAEGMFTFKLIPCGVPVKLENNGDYHNGGDIECPTGSSTSVADANVWL